MTNVTTGKKLLAIAFLACLCVSLVCVPAYGFYYVHNEDAGNEAGLGTYEVLVTVDESAVNGKVTTDLMFLPEGSTAEAILDEAIMSSENQNGLDAIHNYDVQSLRDYLGDRAYTIEVYQAGSQGVGTQTTHDASAYGDGNTAVGRYDNVVVVVSE